jgi:hypothetical protein
MCTVTHPLGIGLKVTQQATVSFKPELDATVVPGHILVILFERLACLARARAVHICRLLGTEKNKYFSFHSFVITS